MIYRYEERNMVQFTDVLGLHIPKKDMDHY